MLLSFVAEGAPRKTRKPKPPEASKEDPQDTTLQPADETTEETSASEKKTEETTEKAEPKETVTSTEGDAVDGFAKVRELAQRNEVDLMRWAAMQEKQPYVFPQVEKVLDAPWGGFFRAVSQSFPVLLPTLLPHLGVGVQSGLPQPILSWPWQFPLGPAYSATRARGEFVVHRYRPFRLLLEPSIWINDPVVVMLRAGGRFIYRPTTLPVGIGGGVGSSWRMTDGGGISISPEVVVQFGKCCEPGYFVLCGRGDIFTNRSPNVWGLSFGYTFF